MQTIAIEAKRREKQSKGEVKRLRRQGRVPGAVFGRGIEPYLVEITTRQLVQVLGSESGLNTMIDLSVEGKKSSVMISELERDPITRGFLHVGFHHVSRTEKIHTHVPIRLTGEPEPVKTKEAVMDQSLERLEVRALPGDLPPYIEVDVSELTIGSVLRVADVPKNDKLEIHTPEDTPIATVHVPRAAVVEPSEAAAEAEAAEAPSEEKGEE
ncbi:MAG TPA: 50S ribosomal protein L25 [Capsulimonadaceae bacterium]|nr:50S ribosomal protein L25 [Capsulimonadaceae bacterium]